ncbi:SMI1/KNR4 family protein [Planococcus donghaensis]|uniref:Cell wall assembly protein n=1 Tax=Planococcus donghaensis TaxID=414778 RepID=A0A1C7EIB6_9BACL|nr:SMI1/KNR4 family protein [Planococcus donghaensis]ANU23396.1 cell wall assembly protein [Planococcus donghaensis]
MSNKTYQKAKKIISKNKDLADFEGQKSVELIEKAEAAVGLQFTGSYLDYLQTFGAGNFGSEEVYGIIDEDFEDSSVPDAIWYTLTLRKSINLPANFLAIYDTGSDEIFCLDFHSTDATGEPKVVALDPTYALEDQTLEIIADDFGDFLLELIEEELA